MKAIRSLFVVLTMAGSATLAHEAPASGVVSLAASADVEVAQDLLRVTFATTREGPDANSVQGALKQALDTALAEAKKSARPGQVDVQTGNFSLYPRSNKQGQISVWQGTAELMVEGRDMSALAQLAGRIQSMTIARVSHGLSREQRTKAEGEVSAQAIARFQAKAGEYAKHFGYTGFVIREVNVSGSEPPPYAPVAMMRAKAMGDAEQALPVEAGKATVSVTVSGSVQLTTR